MPHIVVLYTGNLETQADMEGLCRSLADTMIAQHDEAGAPVFPRGGTRVFALPSAHHAVADGSMDAAFVYLNLRMAKGRSDDVKKRVGDALSAVVTRHFAALLATRPIGITLQIDESPGQVFDAKLGNLHAAFP
jgi:5-carboxymethyl-2-hydroxymuconate isomerase